MLKSIKETIRAIAMIPAVMLTRKIKIESNEPPSPTVGVSAISNIF